jgi:hypothetical protein
MISFCQAGASFDKGLVRVRPVRGYTKRGRSESQEEGRLADLTLIGFWRLGCRRCLQLVRGHVVGGRGSATA